MDGLSRLQMNILTYAATRPGTGKPHGRDGSPTRADCMMRDLLPDNPTQSMRVSLAKSISRLEQRGLVTRYMWWFTVEKGINLTPLGWQMANTGSNETHISRSA